MPTKYLHLEPDVAIHVLHAPPTTLPPDPPVLDRGRCLVFVHGEGACAALWSRQLAHFASGDSPVAIDLPGHGRSSGLDGPPTIVAAAEVLGRTLEALGAPPAVLVGHGSGGQVALATALAQPARVRGVVTIGTAVAPEIPDEAVAKLRDVVRGRLGQQFDTPFFGPKTDVPVMREFWGEMVKTDPRVRLGDVLAYRATDLGPSLGRIACPVAVVQGEADRLCPPERGRALAAAIPGARFHLLPEAGHVAHLEQPDAVNAAIDGLVAR